MSTPFPRRIGIVIFFLAFVIMGLIGYSKGKSAVSNQKYLHARAIRKIKLAAIKRTSSPPRLPATRAATTSEAARVVDSSMDPADVPVSKSAGLSTYSYALVYVVDGMELFRYDIDHKALTGPYASTKSDNDGLMIESPITPEVALIVAGSSVTGFTVKDLLQASGEESRFKVAAGIAGSACGYLIGYKIGTMRALADDDPEMLDLLDTPEKWEPIAREVYKAIAIEGLLYVQYIKDPELAESYRSEMVGRLSHTPTSARLEALVSGRDRILTQAARDRETSPEALSADRPQPIWLRWSFILPICVGTFTLLIFFAWWVGRRTFERPEIAMASSLQLPTEAEVKKFGQAL